MTKLELLNVFLTERLTAAAEEIFRAVKDTVAEYQSEMLRSREENERLKRLLNVAVQRLLLQPEPPSVQLQEERQSCEAEWRRSVELLPNIKEEPKVTEIGPDAATELREACQRSHPPAAPSARRPRGSSPAPTAETDRDPDKPSPAAVSPSPLRPEAGEGVRPAAGASAGATGLRTRTDGSGAARLSSPPPPPAGAEPPPAPPPAPPRPDPGMQRWHSCRECGKGFSFACQLEVHMRWHTKEKPYSCGVCRKSFTTVSMLKRHHRIHTGEKPFPCAVCGKRFNQSAHLNTHLRLHSRERASWPRPTHTRNTHTAGRWDAQPAAAAAAAAAAL